MVSDSPVFFKCPYCPCIFVCQSDLDLHLKRFGDYDHLDLWFCVGILLEEAGHDADVDEHSDWHWSNRKRIHHNKIRKCRRILDEHGFVL